jgi:hypothetical protein
MNEFSRLAAVYRDARTGQDLLGLAAWLATPGDLPVGAVETVAQHADQYTAPARNIVQTRDVGEVGSARLAGERATAS